MSRNGAGTYVLPAGQPVVTGTTISSTVHNTLATDLANALTTSIATDGQSVVTANIPFAGYKLTGVGAATVNGDALRFEDKTALVAADTAIKAGIQAQTYTAFTTAGTSTAYTLTTSPAAAAITEDERYQVEWHTTSGATPTLARDGLTAKNLKIYNATGVKATPPTGAFVAGVKSDIVYDGTDYVVLSWTGGSALGVNSVTTQITGLTTPLTQAQGGTGTALASRPVLQALTTQAGSVATGTTTIPLDDTIPTNTEGDEYMTLPFTPISATSLIVVEAIVFLSCNQANAYLIANLLKDTGSIAVAAQQQTLSTGMVQLSASLRFSAGSTAAFTFRLRAGNHVGGTTTFNGAAGARLFGGNLVSSITATEYL